MTARKVETTLYKQALPLRSDEAVGDFLDALREEARELYGSMPNMGWVWVSEVKSDSIIVSVELDESESWTMKYYKHSYTRDESGFSFGEAVEMKHVSMFVEVSDN